MKSTMPVKMRLRLLLFTLFSFISLNVFSQQTLNVGDEIRFIERFRDDGTDKQILLHLYIVINAVSDQIPVAVEVAISNDND